jgi:hypothetical protein
MYPRQSSLSRLGGGPSASQNRNQLYRVNAFLAEFIVGDERLISAEALGDLDLGQPGFLASFAQEADKRGMAR